MNGGGFAVFTEQCSKGRPLWNAREELKLLDAIERCQFSFQIEFETQQLF